MRKLTHFKGKTDNYHWGASYKIHLNTLADGNQKTKQNIFPKITMYFLKLYRNL